MENNFLDDKKNHKAYIKDILKNYYGIERFKFSSNFSLSGFVHKIEFLPYKYYFQYRNRKKKLICKNYFPSWQKGNNIKSIEFDVNLINWIKSIKRIQKRKGQINISIEEGSEKRKQFDKIVKKI